MGGMRRQANAIEAPSRPLTGFPTKYWPRGSQFFRSVGNGNGPWWFASTDEGRFNLYPNQGTCYLASDIETAIRERAGPALLHDGFVPESFVHAMEVATVECPEVASADISHRSAVKFGCNRELATVPDYEISRAWAQAFHGHGLGGIWYASRFTSARRPNALAVFGVAGDSGEPATSRISGLDAFTKAKMRHMVEPVPSRTQLDILATTPKRRKTI